MASSSRQLRKGNRALLLTLAVAASLIGLAVGLRGQYARFLAGQYRWQLNTVADDRAGALLAEVARLGDPGIPVLVEALGSERESVAAGGKRVLWDEIGRWEALPARQYSPKLAVLAKALADRVERFGPSARADAATLASRILRFWTLDDGAVDTGEVIASCEQVLRATSRQRHLAADQRLWDRPERVPPGGKPLDAGSGGSNVLGELPDDRSPRLDVPFSDVDKLPGGRLPVEMLEGVGAPSGSLDEPRVAEAPRGGPGPSAGDGPGVTLQQPQRLLDGSDAPVGDRQTAVRPGEDRPPDPSEPGPLARSPAGSGSIGSRGDGSTGSDEPVAIATVELMRRLRARDSPAASEARAELVRRGFSEVHLGLARQLFDPHPAVRADLARRVVEAPGVDAAPWLLQLGRDEDPEVRATAIGLMATTGDPVLLDAAASIAREDADPRVRRQAERIALRRRQLGY